jgi:hypothetical protein
LTPEKDVFNITFKTSTFQMILNEEEKNENSWYSRKPSNRRK